MVAFLPILAGGALIVGGIAATGYVADQVGEILHHAGQNQNFENVSEVQDALLRAGRPDLAQQLQIAVQQGNSQAFNTPGTGSNDSLLGDVREILPIALLGYVLVKGVSK